MALKFNSTIKDLSDNSYSAMHMKLRPTSIGVGDFAFAIGLVDTVSQEIDRIGDGQVEQVVEFETYVELLSAPFRQGSNRVSGFEIHRNAVEFDLFGVLLGCVAQRFLDLIRMHFSKLVLRQRDFEGPFRKRAPRM